MPQIFGRAYWRVLLRRRTWMDAWTNLHRVHKDRRARRQIAAISLLITLPIVCVLYARWIAGLGILAAPVAIAAAISFWRSYSRSTSAASTRTKPDPGPQLTLLQQAEFRTYFADTALIYAVILDRAGSERYLKTKVLPDGFVVTTRRVHLDLLKSRGVWEKMTQHDRNALMMPDGQWNPDWVDNVVPAYEAFRLMRWILRIDEFLPVIGKQLRFDWNSAHEIVMDPGKLQQPSKLVQLASIERACKAAEQFYARCLAEQIYRGDAQAKNEDDAKWATELAASLNNKQSEDLVLGVKLVSEVSIEELRWATMLAHRRFRFLYATSHAMKTGAVPQPPYAFQT